MPTKICVASSLKELQDAKTFSTTSGKEISTFPMPLRRAELGYLYLKGAAELIFVGALDAGAKEILTKQASEMKIPVKKYASIAEFSTHLGLNPAAPRALYARSTVDALSLWMPRPPLAAVPEHTAIA